MAQRANSRYLNMGVSFTVKSKEIIAASGGRGKA